VIGACGRSGCGEHVLGRGFGPWKRARLGEGDGPFDAREYLAVHLLPLVVGELALLALEMRDEPRDRVARVRLPKRNFLPGTVIRLTLSFGVRPVTVRLALDQRGASPARARATALLAASWTAKMSFPSTTTPGMP
jgi:hypothetical protein